MTSQPADNHTSIDWPSELQRHHSWMHGIAKSRVGDTHAADDVLQDVSLTVIRQNGRPTDPEKIRAWLYRIVVRRVADHLRRQYRNDDAIAQFARECDVQAEAGPEWVVDANPSELLPKALAQLPEEDRILFHRKYSDNWSYQQLAEQFGLSERAVEYRLVSARQRLRKEMQALRNRGEYS